MFFFENFQKLHCMNPKAKIKFVKGEKYMYIKKTKREKSKSVHISLTIHNVNVLGVHFLRLNHF